MSDRTRTGSPAPDVSFDGGDLDCGNGLLLLIRQHIDPLDPGGLLEILSSEPTVKEDLPAWCRLTGNDMVRVDYGDERNSYLVCKGVWSGGAASADAAAGGDTAPAVATGFGGAEPVILPDGRRQAPLPQPVEQPFIPESLPEPVPVPALPPLAVMGVGSWPRPRWLLTALHEHLQGRMSDEDFEATADDAVALAVQAQMRAGVDLVTDGEQRRDNYSSFVGGLLQNCQLVPLTDLLPYVEDPEEFRREMDSLDVPASQVRHPAVFGPLGRNRPLAVHELRHVQTLTDTAVKVALPGPYLLTRTMWMECISDRAYDSREDLSVDVVRVLREELAELLAGGAALVQFDEPVLTEVAYGRPDDGGGRSFMCGALGDKLPVTEELAFAEQLLTQVLEGFPRERLALHVCRGNWTPDEAAALSGDYGPMLGLFSRVPVGTLVLELCTPRAGDAALLEAIPKDRRIGFGVVDQKSPMVETVEEVVQRVERAIALFGPERLMLNPDCGFATFADNPITAAKAAEGKLRAMVGAAALLREKYLGIRP